VYLQENGLEKEEIHIFGDSQMAIKQMQGEYKIDPQKAYGYMAVRNAELIQQFNNLKFKWIPREENTFADKAAETALLEIDIKRKIWSK